MPPIITITEAFDGIQLALSGSNLLFPPQPEGNVFIGFSNSAYDGF